MDKNVKRILVPLTIIVILLCLYFTRWEHETTFKPNQTMQVS